MSSVGQPDDVAPETAEPEVTYVVRDDPPRPGRAVSTNEVAPGRGLRWLWVVFGLLVLAGVVWALVRGCDADSTGAAQGVSPGAVECDQVPDAVFTQTVQVTALATLVEWVPEFAVAHQDEAIAALRALCDARLSYIGTGHWYDGDAVQNAFTPIAADLTPEVITNIQDLVAGNTFCRCS